MPRAEHADSPGAGDQGELTGDAPAIEAEVLRLRGEVDRLRGLLAAERAMFETALSDGAAELGVAVDARAEMVAERDRLQSALATRTDEVEQARARVRDQREQLTKQRERITRLRERLERSETEVATLRSSGYRRARAKAGSVARRMGLRR